MSPFNSLSVQINVVSVLSSSPLIYLLGRSSWLWQWRMQVVVKSFGVVSLQVVPYGAGLTRTHLPLGREFSLQGPGIRHPGGGGKVSLGTENLMELDPLILCQTRTKRRAGGGNWQYSLTLRRGRQQRALFYIIHVKNTIFAYILFIVFSLNNATFQCGFDTGVWQRESGWESFITFTRVIDWN